MLWIPLTRYAEIKFKLSTQGASWAGFLISPLYMCEFLLDNGLVQDSFLTYMHFQEICIFFNINQPLTTPTLPPPSQATSEIVDPFSSPETVVSWSRGRYKLSRVALGTRMWSAGQTVETCVLFRTSHISFVTQHELHVPVTGNIFTSDACSLHKEFCHLFWINANRYWSGLHWKFEDFEQCSGHRKISNLYRTVSLCLQ